MRLVFFIPPLKQMSGGLANIYAVAQCLRDLGGDTALQALAPETPGLADAVAGGLKVLPPNAPLGPNDTLCIPEGWPNAMVPALDGGATVTVYAQNWVYMLGTLPKDVRWKDLPVTYLAVSRPVAAFLRTALGVEAKDILPPLVHDDFFISDARPRDRVRVAYMPRKNRAIAEQAMETAKARLATAADAPRVEWVSIHKASRREVADTLATCHLYLATGFPEGFGLPPLEAMASGCAPVGCTGFGGWEYMRQAFLPGLASPLTPPPFLDLEAEDGGNGFYFADGDSLGAGLALADAAVLAHENGPAWQALSERCRETARRYDAGAQREAVRRIFL